MAKKIDPQEDVIQTEADDEILAELAEDLAFESEIAADIESEFEAALEADDEDESLPEVVDIASLTPDAIAALRAQLQEFDAKAPARASQAIASVLESHNIHDFESGKFDAGTLTITFVVNPAEHDELKPYAAQLRSFKRDADGKAVPLKASTGAGGNRVIGERGAANMPDLTDKFGAKDNFHVFDSLPGTAFTRSQTVYIAYAATHSDDTEWVAWYKLNVKPDGVDNSTYWRNQAKVVKAALNVNPVNVVQSAVTIGKYDTIPNQIELRTLATSLIKA